MTTIHRMRTVQERPEALAVIVLREPDVSSKAELQ